MIIAPAEPGDVPDLAALMAGAPLLQRYGLTPAAAAGALEAALRAGDLLLVAREADAPPVALAWAIAGRVLTGVVYLRLLLIGEGRQRAGLGARLLGEAEAWARERANHLLLLVTTDNAGARRFYERHGYRRAGDLPDFAAPGIDEALYHKPLRPHGDRLPV